MNNNCEAIILCGGLGTRLNTLTGGKPKILIDINGKPFIYYLLRLLKKQGFGRVILCTGFLKKQIKDIIGDDFNGVEIVYSEEEKKMGTGGAIRLAYNKINSESVAIMNGDTWWNLDFANISNFFINKNSDALLVLCNQKCNNIYGNVSINAESKIIDFMEKIPNKKKSYVSAGFYMVKTSLIQKIEKDKTISIEKTIIPDWVKNYNVYGYIDNNSFYDIGTPDSYRCFINYWKTNDNI